jgi:hypothetical protein
MESHVSEILTGSSTDKPDRRTLRPFCQRPVVLSRQLVAAPSPQGAQWRRALATSET